MKIEYVWDGYFKYDEKMNKSKCFVNLGDQSMCGHLFKGQYAKTLMDHLWSKHLHLKINELNEK